MKILFGLLLTAQLWAQGTVSQSTSQLGQSQQWVVNFNFVADPATGAVPNTAAILSNCCQGYIFTSVEVIPKSPAPSGGWGLKVQDTAGVDILGGGGASLSTTNPVSLAPSSSAAPLNGTFSIVITGNTTGSAAGSIYVYLTKPGVVNIVALTKGVSNGIGGPIGGSNTQFIFNQAGTLGGVADFTYVGHTISLGAAGILDLSAGMVSSTSGSSTNRLLFPATGTTITTVDPGQTPFPVGALKTGWAYGSFESGLNNPSDYGNLVGRYTQFNVLNGRNQRDNADKKSIYGDRTELNFAASGQRGGGGPSIIAPGSGDVLAMTADIYYNNDAPALGDEGMRGISTRMFQQAKFNFITSDTAGTVTTSSCAITALAANVAKSPSPGVTRTVTVTGATNNCAIGDWLDIDNGISRDIVAIVNTSGTAVSYVSGNPFPPVLTGQISIGGVLYTVSSVTNSTNLVLTSSAGTQSGVQLNTTPPGGCGTSTAGPNSDLCHESVQILAKTSNSITAIFYSSHFLGAPVATSPVIATTNPEWGQDAIVVDSTATPYTTGTAYAPGGAGFGSTIITGVGTSWTSLTGYNQANLRYCISFRSDDFTTSPYSGGNPLIAYFPIKEILTDTQLVIMNGGYNGHAVSSGTASAFSIVPCGYTSIVVPATTATSQSIAGLVMRSTGFAWTTGHTIKHYPVPDSHTQSMFNAQFTAYGLGSGPNMVELSNFGTTESSNGILLDAAPNFTGSTAAYHTGFNITSSATTAIGGLRLGSRDLSGIGIQMSTRAAPNDYHTLCWQGTHNACIFPDVLNGLTLESDDISRVRFMDASHANGFSLDYSGISGFPNLKVPNINGATINVYGPGPLTRSLTATPGDTIEIGSINGMDAHGGANFDVYANFTDGVGPNPTTKQFNFPVWYETGACNWYEVKPITDSGLRGGTSDFALDVNNCPSPNGKATLRLRRTAGTGTKTVEVNILARTPLIFVPSSATGSGGTVTGTYAPTSITQINNLLRLWNATGFAAVLDPTNLTAERTITLQDTTGKLALATGSPANNDCVKFVIAGGVTSLGTAGGGCGTSSGYNLIQSNGSAVAAETTVNFISGSNATVNCVDNPGSSKTDCTISASSSAGARLDQITAATGANSINSADNAQVWNWSLSTASKLGMTFGENAASTGSGSVLVDIQTLNTSTALPLRVTAQGTANGIQVSTAGVLSALGTGHVNADQINGSTVIGTLGNVVSFGASNVLSDAGFLATNVIRKEVANTGSAGMTLDLSGLTGANSFRVPVGAGFIAGTAGTIAYDSVLNNMHIWQAGADALVGAFASFPPSGQCVQTSVSGGTLLLTTSGGPCGTAATTSWSSLTSPSGNLSLSMGNTFSQFLWGTATGSSTLWSVGDSPGNTGVGTVFAISASGTGMNPWLVQAANGNGWQVLSSGLLNSLAGTNTARISLNGKTSGGTTLTVPDSGSSLTFKFPGAAGSANFPLLTDGSGNTSWTALPFSSTTGVVPFNRGGTNSTSQITSLSGTGAALATVAGSTVTNDCAKFDGTGALVDAGFPCGTGGGGTANGWLLGTSTQGYEVTSDQCSLVGDGSTDNYTNLKNCLTGVTFTIPAQGFVLRMKPGVYAIDLVGGRTPITITKDNVKIRGEAGYTNTGLCYPGSTPGACLSNTVIRATGSSWTGNYVLTWDGSGTTRNFVDGPELSNIDVDGNNLAGGGVRLKNFNGGLIENFSIHDWVGTAQTSFGLDLTSNNVAAIGTCGNGGGLTIINNGNIQSYRGTGTNAMRFGDPSFTNVDICSVKVSNLYLANNNYPGNHTLYIAAADSNQFNNLSIAGFAGSPGANTLLATSSTTATLTLGTAHNVPASATNDGIFLVRVCTTNSFTAPPVNCNGGTEVKGLEGTLSAAYLSPTTLAISGAYGLTNGVTYYVEGVHGADVELGPIFTSNMFSQILTDYGIHNQGNAYNLVTGWNWGETIGQDPTFSKVGGTAFPILGTDGSLWNMTVRSTLPVEPIGPFANSLISFSSARATGGTVPDFQQIIDFTNAVKTSAGYYPIMIANGTRIAGRSNSSAQVPLIGIDTSNVIQIGTPGVQAQFSADFSSTPAGESSGLFANMVFPGTRGTNNYYGIRIDTADTSAASSPFKVTNTGNGDSYYSGNQGSGSGGMSSTSYATDLNYNSSAFATYGASLPCPITTGCELTSNANLFTRGLIIYDWSYSASKELAMEVANVSGGANAVARFANFGDAAMHIRFFAGHTAQKEAGICYDRYDTLTNPCLWFMGSGASGTVTATPFTLEDRLNSRTMFSATTGSTSRLFANSGLLLPTGSGALQIQDTGLTARNVMSISGSGTGSTGYVTTIGTAQELDIFTSIGLAATFLNSGALRITPLSGGVASLPACGAGTDNAIIAVNDQANASTNFGDAATSGGTAHVLLHCNSVSWTVMAK